MKLDIGPKVSPILDETVYRTREAFGWLASTANAVEGRDFFGDVTVTLRYEAGQVVAWRPGVERSVQ
jgi:hypothetical protein